MPTDILCEHATSARFNAGNGGVFPKIKTFISNQPPLIREDHEQSTGIGSSFFSGSNGAGNGAPTLIANPIPATGYKLTQLTTGGIYASAQLQLIVNGVLVRNPANINVNPNEPVGAWTFKAGDVVGVKQNSFPGGVPFNFYFINYAITWGHRVTDQAGQTEIFLTGHPTKPAPFTSSCGNQCPPGQVRCGDCCLDCKSVAGQIAAMAGRL